MIGKTNAVTILGAPSGGTGEYERPQDWLPIPDLDGTKDEIYLLKGVSAGDFNKIKFHISSLAGPITIDWGDGTTPTITTIPNIFEHDYNFDDIAESSWTKHNGTKQVLIRITGDRGSIRHFSLALGYDYINADGDTVSPNSTNTTNYLYEVNANVDSCQCLCGDGSNFPCRHLEIFDWKGSLTNSTFAYMFANCYALQVIPQLDTSLASNFDNMFSNCYSLKKIPKINTKQCTQSSSMFNGCYALQTLPQLDFSANSNIGYMFYNCYSLQNISLVKFGNFTQMSSVFSNCRSLENILLDCSSITASPSSAVSSCYSLQNVILYNLGAAFTSNQTLSSFANSRLMTRQQILNLINSIAPNTQTITLTMQLGSTLQSRVANVYVKDSGVADSYILPTSDTIIDNSKEYWTFDEKKNEYISFTGAEFEDDVVYYETKIASWNKYIICESTDEGAMLMLDYARNIKGWTIT